MGRKECTHLLDGIGVGSTGGASAWTSCGGRLKVQINAIKAKVIAEVGNALRVKLVPVASRRRISAHRHDHLGHPKQALAPVQINIPPHILICFTHGRKQQVAW